MVPSTNWLSHQPLKLEVVGSNPTGITIALMKKVLPKRGGRKERLFQLKIDAFPYLIGPLKDISICTEGWFCDKRIASIVCAAE